MLKKQKNLANLQSIATKFVAISRILTLLLIESIENTTRDLENFC